MAYQRPPLPDASQMDSLLLQMGEMKASMAFMLAGQEKLQDAMTQIIPRGEHEAKWSETDRRFKDLEADVHELQGWRNSFYQQSGTERMEITQDINKVASRNDELTINRNAAIMGILIATLLGLLVYIAQHTH